MAGIGIITNPHSKLNKRNPDNPRLLSYILGEKGVLETTNNLSDLARVAHQFKERNIDILAINGGDGTISRTLTAFIKEYGEKPLPDVALLRGGTMNVVASNLKIRGNPEQILYRLLELISSQDKLPTTRLQLLHADGIYGFLLGTGIVANYLKLYYKKKSNALGAILLIIKFYWSYFFDKEFFSKHIHDDELNLHWDKKNLKERSMTVFCSTVERMPLGLKLFPLARAKPNHMQCVSFAIPPQEFIWKLPFCMVHNKEGNSFGKKSWIASGLLIEGTRPIDYTVDGELFSSESGKLQINPGPVLNFILL